MWRDECRDIKWQTILVTSWAHVTSAQWFRKKFQSLSNKPTVWRATLLAQTWYKQTRRQVSHEFSPAGVTRIRSFKSTRDIVMTCPKSVTTLSMLLCWETRFAHQEMPVRCRHGRKTRLRCDSSVIACYLFKLFLTYFINSWGFMWFISSLILNLSLYLSKSLICYVNLAWAMEIRKYGTWTAWIDVLLHNDWKWRHDYWNYWTKLFLIDKTNEQRYVESNVFSSKSLFTNRT